jgi:hypothetical protein
VKRFFRCILDSLSLRIVLHGGRRRFLRGRFRHAAGSGEALVVRHYHSARGDRHCGSAKRTA